MSYIRMSHVTGGNRTAQWTRVSYLVCWRFWGHTCEWVISHTWTSHIRVSHVAHMNESYHTYARLERWWFLDHIYKWAMSHTWTSHIRVSHVTHINQSWHTYACLVRSWFSSHTYELAMSHIWMSHVTYMMSGALMIPRSPIWVSCVTHLNHVARMNKSCDNFDVGRVDDDFQVTHMNESCHTYGWIMQTHDVGRVVDLQVTHTKFRK